MGFMNYIRIGVSLFFEYDTPRIVHIKSKKVGVINRFIQLLIIGYIIGWAIIYKKGYQETDRVKSSVESKVKGVVFSDYKDIPSIGSRVWDVADYVENNAFFIMTNVIVSPRQSLGVCDEDPERANCTADPSVCRRGEPVENGNGVMTGECVNSTQRANTKSCQIHAWCPVEVDKLPVPGEAVLAGSRNFTVLLKNQIEFPFFGVKKHCRYHPSADPFCPIFVVGDIIEACGEDYDEISVTGGVIAFNIEWNCNLDFSFDTYCTPRYSFSRLDNKNATQTLAPGWNFRFSQNYRENGTAYRDLYKAYGIRFVIFVTGEAGKFNAVPLLLNIGSGLALLSLATIMCDIVVLYFLKKGGFYRERKYLTVKGDDAFLVNESIADDEDGYRSRPTSESHTTEPKQRMTASQRYTDETSPLMGSSR